MDRWTDGQPSAFCHSQSHQGGREKFISAADLICSHLFGFHVHTQYVCIWAGVNTQREAEALEILCV